MDIPLTDRIRSEHFLFRKTSMLRGMIIIVAATELIGGLELRSQILPFRSYSVRDGLSSNNINTMYQDSRGYMWFGTTEGISVFDGRTFTNYSALNGLPHNFVTRIFEDRTTPGRMWVLAGDNVCRLIDGEIFNYPLPDSSVGSIYQDHEGVVWCGTNHGLIRIKDDKPAFFRPKLLDGHVGLIAEVGDSLMWFASEGHGLVSYSGASHTFSQIDIDQYGEGAIWSMFGDHQGNLWVGMNDQYLLRIHGKDMVTARVLHGPTSWVTEDGKGILWLGGYGGIGSISKDQFVTSQTLCYTTANGLPENTVRSLYVDREQNLWVGGRDEGVAKLSTIRTLRFEIGAPSEFALAHDLQYAVSDANGHIWVLTDRGLQEFWRDLDGRWERFIYLTGPIGQTDWVPWLLQFSGGRLWIGRLYLSTTPHQYRLECCTIASDPGGGHSRLEFRKLASPMLPSSSGLGFIVGRDGIIWQALGSKGIASWDPSQKSAGMRFFGENDGVPTNYIRTLIQDHDGDIWGGSIQDGVVRLSPDQIPGHRTKRFTPANGLPDWGVWSIMEDRLGEILVGTSRGGLAVIRGDSVQRISSKEGMPSTTVYCMTEDATGRLWLGTQIGMVYEDPPGLKRFLKNQAFLGSGVHGCGRQKTDYSGSLRRRISGSTITSMSQAIQFHRLHTSQAWESMGVSGRSGRISGCPTSKTTANSTSSASVSATSGRYDTNTACLVSTRHGRAL
jgi:ligand-binding sensor domain-containing protein